MRCVLMIFVAGVVFGRPVDRHKMFWDSLPGADGTDSPYVANGDIGALYGNDEVGGGRDARTSSAQLLSTSKQDLWQSEASPEGTYFTHLSAAQLVINATEMGSKVDGTVVLDPGAATLATNITDGNIVVLGETWVGEAPYEAVYYSFVCTRNDSVSTCDITLTLRENGDPTDLVTRVGGTTSDLYLRKEILRDATNPAWTASCSPSVLYYNTERQFVISGSSFSMSNGSCPWVLDPNNATNSRITTGSCSEPQGSWKWQSNDTHTGKIAWTGDSAKNLCLTGSGNSVSLTPCSNAPIWFFNSSTGYVQDPDSGCLMVVPDNTNNTLGVGVVVAQTSSGAIVTSSSPAQPLNSSIPSAGVSYDLKVQAGTNYTVIMALKTLRDNNCAGTRQDTDQCGDVSIEAVAVANATLLASSLSDARQGHDAFWSTFWNASSIDLTQGSNESNSDAQRLEYAFYAFTYSLGSNVRPGKVTPSLYGILTTGTDKWNDQLTLDYNLESNYWGAGITNHADLLSVYASTVTNPALLKTMQARASNPGVWNNPPSAKWPGDVGSVAGEAACAGSDDGVCHVANDLKHSGAYAGAAWPSTAFPLGDGRPAPTDLATRFVGGLVATPLIQYYEYTRDVDVLNASVYPVVRDNADFYASFAVPYNDSSVYFPFTCAQEGCDCRNGLSWYWRWGKYVQIPLPNMTVETLTYINEGKGGSGVWDTSKGEHNAQIDIAFASQNLRKAAEYSAVLGVDADKRQNWLNTLSKLPPYPQQTLNWVKSNGSDIVIGSQLSGKPMLVEAQAGATPAVEQQVIAAGNSTIIWPTCNVEYPITNFAMMWPTDELAFADAELFEAAKTTTQINKYTGYTFAGSKFPYSNQNGFGLSWPPAVRVSNRTDAPLLISYLANASNHQTGHNGVVATGGGCLENMAATAAISELLFQSYDGVLRFFPVWASTITGPASFSTLRAYGAFLVSASIDNTGTVGPITITSEKGTSPCMLESPWNGQPTITQDGNKVDVWPVSRTRHGVQETVYAFNTTVATTYTVTSS